jgi:hypothetical protein
MRRHCDGHYRNAALLDQCLPTAEGARNIRAPSNLGRTLHVTSRKRHYFATGIATECRDEDPSPIVSSRDSNTNHDVPYRTCKAPSERQQGVMSISARCQPLAPLMRRGSTSRTQSSSGRGDQERLLSKLILASIAMRSIHAATTLARALPES